MERNILSLTDSDSYPALIQHCASFPLSALKKKRRRTGKRRKKKKKSSQQPTQDTHWLSLLQLLKWHLDLPSCGNCSAFLRSHSSECSIHSPLLAWISLGIVDAFVNVEEGSEVMWSERPVVQYQTKTCWRGTLLGAHRSGDGNSWLAQARVQFRFVSAWPSPSNSSFLKCCTVHQYTYSIWQSLLLSAIICCIWVWLIARWNNLGVAVKANIIHNEKL